MKSKSLVGAVLALVFAAVLPGAARAEEGVAQGAIYSVDLVEKYGGRIPTAEEPLHVGETAVIRVRLANANWSDPSRAGTPRPWFLVPRAPGLEELYPLELGIMLGGQATYAYYVDKEDVAAPAATYTDLYFAYTVKSGDLALPAYLMDSSEKAAGESGTPEYFLRHKDMWEITNVSGDTVIASGLFHFTTQGGAMPVITGQPQNYTPSGRKMGLFVQTVDFDDDYVVPPSPEDEAGVWRRIYQGMTTTTTTLPSVVPEGVSDANTRVFVWVDDETVAVPEGAQKVTDVIGETTYERYVLPVLVAKDATKAEFRLRAKGALYRTAKVMMSSSEHLTGDDMDHLVTNWVERVVQVWDPPPPSVVVRPSTTRAIASSDYKRAAARLTVSLTQPVSAPVTVRVTPKLSDGTDISTSEKAGAYVRFSLTEEEVTTLPDATNGVEVTIGPGPASEAAIYVFCLRGDEHTSGGSELQFKPTWVSGPEAEITDWTSGGFVVEAQDPVVESMFGGTDAAAAIADSPRSLEIVVSDTYADTHCDPDAGEGYEIWIVKDKDSSGDTSFKKLDGLYKPGKGGMLFLTNTVDTLPTVTYSGEKALYNSMIYVKSPISGNQSANHDFTVTVKTPDRIVVEYDDEHDEGDEVQLDIHLEDADGNRIKNTQGDLYVFIKGDTDEDTAAIDCKWKAAAGGKGIKFPNYGFAPSAGTKLTLLDGDESKSGLLFSYSVVFLNQQTWTDDENARVTVYKNNEPVVFFVHNVKPSVDFVSVNDGAYEVFESGTTIGRFPAGVTNWLSAVVTEPGEIDKTATGENAFKVRWRITDPYGSPAVTEIKEGNPDETSLGYDFPAAGIYKVTVDLKDKDMTKYGDGEYNKSFTFNMEVIDQPAITVEHSGTYYETEALDEGGEAEMRVTLGLNNCDFPMDIQMTITPNNAKVPGTLLLQEGSNVRRLPDVVSADKTLTSTVYVVTFPKRTTEMPLLIETMDGTVNSRTTGFAIALTNLTETVVPQSGGRRACDYYVGVAPKAVKIYNVPPQLDPSTDVYPVPGTNAIPETVGLASEAITWSFSDVHLDFSRGIRVKFIGGGGREEKTFYTRDEAMADGAAGWRPTFSSPGDGQTVKLIITDPDGGSASVTWVYDITGVKTIFAVAHGPGTGYGAGHSKLYRSAAGLGEGRVFAESKSEIATVGFKSTINNGSTDSAYVFAYGYKVGDRDDGATLHKPDGFGGHTLGYYLGRDTPIDADGNNLAAGGTPYAYDADPVELKYKDANGNPCDSFLYTWLKLTISDDGKTTSDEFLNSATSPEYTEAHDTGAAVSLKQETSIETGAGFTDTFLEAIFSREWLASDNMGDINADGIPDIYVDKYGLGVVDTTNGEMTGDDLKAITAENNGNTDEDYLPAVGYSAYASLIPGLPESWTDGTPFVARTEIRGYGYALNDAPQQAGVQNVRPDRVYTDPRTDPKSTLDGLDPNGSGEPVEYYAWLDFAAAHGIDDPTNIANKAAWARWSPERPTDPMEPDTDDDGFEDGYEYFFWYRAHVGYMEGGVHRYLTGRAYDPRNPGEGRFISSEEIERIMDPRLPYGDSSSAKTRDTDNDGLPDLLEFQIGTNPFDFDTDGDGLPDGWEICNVGNLDPLRAASHLDGKSDTARNSDGDAMAITSYALESKQKPVPLDIRHAKRTTFAVIDRAGIESAEGGDTDGVQWYATKMSPEEVLGKMTAVTNAASVWSFEADERFFVSTEKPALTAEGILAKTLEKGIAFVSTKPVEVVTNAIYQIEDPENPGTTNDVEVAFTNTVAAALYPVRLEAGTPVRNLSVEKIDSAVTTLAAEIKEADANACWIYGKGAANARYGEVAETAADYGCLALGRYKKAPAGRIVCALPSDGRDVAFLHYLVYQEFGFDPRTAWSSSDPVHPRWGKTTSDGEAVQGVYVKKQGGYTGSPARTRDYANYDEFLVYSFFVNNGCEMSGLTRITDPKADPLVVIWDMFTTNPQGPDEKLPPTSGEAAVTGYGRGTNGADTDSDGVPDGWELYVMAGPANTDGSYVFAPPYAGFAGALSGKDWPLAESYFSPFLDFAKKQETNNQIYFGGEQNDDGLNEFREFEGTDSTGWYADVQSGKALPYSTTVVHDGEWKWFNKFFPTDPWNIDTDQDGLSDAAEKGAFAYGTPADDGKLWSIPGGGLNPCSVDTDLDGLPDPWELQFKPKEGSGRIYAGAFADYAKDASGAAVGNPLQGLTDGMDGTVKDAFSYPIEYADHTSGSTNVTTYVIADGFRQVVNRDYDRDGLENWQEYLTGTMRCWRYDDPYGIWTYIPKELYFDKVGDEWLWNPKFAELGVADEEEFWYRTLVDRASPIYNPGLVTDSSPVTYFSRVTNPWDCAYLDSDLGAPGAYYWFKDRIGDQKLEDLWGDRLSLVAGADTLANPSRYPSCSPIDHDSDHDGMDDYYELFHGLNPLLGQSGVRLDDKGACDLVYDSWAGGDGNSFSAWGGPDGKKPNYWQLDPAKTAQAAARKAEGSNGYDFEVYPWLNGIADADPDGDILPNQEEALLPKLSKVAFHTDPSPLWMTDTSYAQSLTRMFFRLPARFEEAWPKGHLLDGATFVFGGETYDFTSFDNWVPAKGMVPAHFGSFVPDSWSLAAEGEENWMCSFEENEGYDSDHDGISDFEEKEGLFRAATDPQDADSPRRRSAMYFQGPSKPSALQTMPFVEEDYPTEKGYPDELAFIQFSAECWVKPEALADSIILERAVWTGLSSPGDAEYMRKNFQLGIRTGSDGQSYWFAKYDPVGTADDTHEVVALSESPATVSKWTHLAATYDGTALVLYVNGQRSTTVKSEVPPSWGASVIALTEDRQDFWFDREHELKAIVIGAGAKTQKQGAPDGNALDVTQGRGFDRYTGFFTGWIDEVRIWDGARTATEIAGEWNVRYDAELAAKNRAAFYDEWKAGKRRYEEDGSGKDVTMPAELRFHWAFDSIFGAENENALAVAPHAFDGQRATLSRPKDWGIAWWQAVLGGYGSLYDRGRADWVPWIPNTVAHLPRFDGTTLDSVYWCADFEGAEPGTFRFARTAEPVSKWTQYVRNGVKSELDYQTTGSRHFEFNVGSHENGTEFATLFRFAGRNLNQSGDDLLPLGGAYAKFCDAATGLWDGQGPSSNWEITGDDPDGEGLPKWWEEYADENYRGAMTPAGDLGWKTIIDYHGRAITAGEAYLRDLAKGSYEDAHGEPVIGDERFRQVADEDANGIPDWWAEIYGIRGESGLADHDNDGLPNYVEYLLSEVFAFKTVFDPTVADSVQKGVPDYFYRPAGSQLYVGEIFTDHDRMYDDWEDRYPAKQLSRLAYDAYGDPDGDGWANVSEMLAGTDPTLTRRLGIEDQVLADYPVPMIRTRVKIPDHLPESTPIVVQAFSGSIDGKPDAIWQTGASEGSFAKAKFIGTNPGGVRRYFLSPGSISQGKVAISFNDENAVTYTYTVIGGNPTLTKSVITGSGWYPVVTDRPRSDDNSLGDLIKYDGEIVGWIDYVTGEIELDYTCEALQEAAYIGETGTAGTGDNAQATETRTVMDLRKALVRFSWSAKLVKQGSLSDLYLSDADEGYLREGKNAFVAWADKDGNGKWQPGEPYGIVRDIDVSWSGTTAEIELSDLSPVTPRIQLAGSSEGGKGSESKKSEGEETAGDPDELDPASDRGRTIPSIMARIRENLEYDYSGASPVLYSNALERLSWMNIDVVEPVQLVSDEFREQRIRVVRWLINDRPAYLAGSTMRTVLDKRIRTDLKTSITEADFLVGNENAFDLDWEHLYDEVIDNIDVSLRCGEVRSVSYLVVVGDGPADWDNISSSNYTVRALNSVIVRKFGEEHAVPTAVAPGAQAEEIVRSANPTFKWAMDCPEDEGYTAFNIQVLYGSTVIYDSGKRLAPPRNAEGQYVWEAPLYVGDRTNLGVLFANKKPYSWRVSMYNAKYSDEAAYSAAGNFRMEVQTAGYEYGSANVAVRYYGPKAGYVSMGSVIRVRAYTTPDFTGLPVAAGFVENTSDVASYAIAKANCTVVGIPRGTYYLQAFIDSNGNGACDRWEAQGCLCTRDGSTPNYLDPTAITFDSEVGKGDLAVIYLEDADTDGDGLPDVWEWDLASEAGRADGTFLGERGVEFLTETKAGEFVINIALSGALALQENAKVPTAGLAGRIRNNLMSLASPAGVSLVTGIDAADIVQAPDGGFEVRSEIDPETLVITGLKVDAANRRVLLKVGAEVTANVDSVGAGFFNIRVTKGAEVKIRVESAKTPAGPWNELSGVGGTVTVDKAGADIVVELDGELPAQGYFRAKVLEK